MENGTLFRCGCADNRREWEEEGLELSGQTHSHHKLARIKAVEKGVSDVTLSALRNRSGFFHSRKTPEYKHTGLQTWEF